MDSVEWESKSQEDKDALLAELNGEESKSVIELSDDKATENKATEISTTNKAQSVVSKIDAELIRHIRRIDEDVHFIKTVVLVYIILSVIVYIYLGVKMALIF